MNSKDSPKVWKTRRVQRADAGGTLWAPVDQNGNESGLCPSYDAAAIDAECDRLNRAQEAA